MTFRVVPGDWVVVGFDGPPGPEDLAALEAPPAQLVREDEETTLLVRASFAPGILARHPGARIERDLAWVRFDAPMDWSVVGFLARVTGELASAGVPLGAVCGYSRDHLFVSRRHLDAARAALGRLFPERAGA
jgi:hypothetical protein